MEQTFLNTSLWNEFCIFFTSGAHFNDTPCLSLEKKNVIFHLLFKSKKRSILIFEIQFPMLLFLRLLKKTDDNAVLTRVFRMIYTTRAKVGDGVLTPL